MKTIAITGGKGGVGKSTVAVLLATALSKKRKTVLVDADVECPNDHLLVGKSLKTVKSQITAGFPKLIREKCRRCGLCAHKCRFNAIFAPKGRYPLFLHDLCSNCGLCWHICPFGAVTSERKKTGEIFENQVNHNLTLITGRSTGLIGETGPLVGKLKKYAMHRAQELKADVLLIDTAPGTHCNVIQALLDIDYALVVTEPTPLGAHDLRLILDLLKKLKIESSVVINQFNLAKIGEVLEISKKFKVSVAFKIPYSQEILRLYSKGKLLEKDMSKIKGFANFSNRL